MNTLIDSALAPVVGPLRRSGLLADDLDYHLVRASMVIMFLLFGYQKWWAYEAKVLVPFIEHGPLIWWLYPVFGVRGASWFLGVAEWTFGALIFAGYWEQAARRSRRLGLGGDLRRDRHHHPIHAERLGSGRGISGDGGQRRVPYEGHRAARGLGLPLEAGRGSPQSALNPEHSQRPSRR
jgi:Protein of unknown function, DUF417